VNRSLHMLRGGKIAFGSPKTARGRRMIAISPHTTTVLREHRDKMEVRRAMLGILLRNDDLVFSNVEGKPLLPNTVSYAWIKLVRCAVMKLIRLHDARHTHASIMLKQGPKVVQERLGHSIIQVTLDTYSPPMLLMGSKRLLLHVLMRLLLQGIMGFIKKMLKNAISKLLAKF